MRTLGMVLIAMAASGCVYERDSRAPDYRVVQRPMQPLTQDAVVRLVKAGVSEEVILEKIGTDGLTARPTADEMVSLKKEGVSDRVIGAMVSARIPNPAEIGYEPRTVYRDYVVVHPGWPWGPWWGWGWCYPHYYFHWRFR